ncbi:MAG TPA: helix-turn-helix domain-containing protein [Solirubrobacterales bacterium]|jgi:AcrR family transcriptional regulator
MIELVAERGYDDVTVRELAGCAGVSQSTLYKHFPSKQECFLDTYEMIVRCGVQRTLAAQRRASAWRERLRLGICAFVGELARDPRAAHLALVDCYSAWPDLLERMGRTAGLFDALLTDSVAHAPDGGTTLPPRLAQGIVAGIACVVRERLITGRELELTEVGEELVEWSLSLLNEEPGEFGCLDGQAVLAPPARVIGPDGLGATEAPLDERSLLLSATTRLATEDGFSQLSVPRIRAAAGVSRQSFDAHFENATDCFLAAIESNTGHALLHAVRAGVAPGDWPGGICRTLAALCRLLASDERLATLTFVEVFAPGPAGVRSRARLLVEVAAGLRASAPADQRPTAVAAEASLGAIWGLAHAQIADGRAKRMPEIAGTLAFIALVPAIGAEAAAEEIRAEQLGAVPRPTGPRAAGATALA